MHLSKKSAALDNSLASALWRMSSESNDSDEIRCKADGACCALCEGKIVRKPSSRHVPELSTVVHVAFSSSLFWLKAPAFPK